MTKEEIIALVVETVRKHDAKQKKVRHDRRLYNTRLLMKNYNALKEHCDNSVSTLDDDDVCNLSAIDILDNIDNTDKDVYIESIRRSNIRTRIMVDHIDVMLELFNAYCKQTDNQRKFEIVVGYYLQGKSTKDLAEEQNIDIRTCQRDVKFAIEKLSALIFGIDGLSVMS
ncbi:sigma-70 family RNA polymerase sigma factor [Propionispira raffinosivorans]|uniref:sigma-70 family RNA polymerase sigma factor n=1 Tax=Propionispira raffinosivorans TaxID=86959 RepID=UPI0003637991|nr:sigma-70 family RNA polymerase sigma factor [Propionispira raffinosivorans]